MSYVKRFWRGEIPLVITYWVFGGIVSGVIIVVGYLLTNYLEYLEISGRSYGSLYAVVGLLTFLYLIFILVYMIFLWVAIWRSSNRYEGPRSWAFLAKMTVVINVLTVALELPSLL